MYNMYLRLLVEEQRRREEVEKRHQEEEIKRRRETRTRVIQELVQTEKDYLRSITVCHDTFFDSGFPRVNLTDKFVLHQCLFLPQNSFMCVVFNLLLIRCNNACIFRNIKFYLYSVIYKSV